MCGIFGRKENGEYRSTYRQAQLVRNADGSPKTEVEVQNGVKYKLYWYRGEFNGDQYLDEVKVAFAEGKYRGCGVWFGSASGLTREVPSTFKNLDGEEIKKGDKAWHSSFKEWFTVRGFDVENLSKPGYKEDGKNYPETFWISVFVCVTKSKSGDYDIDDVHPSKK